MVKILLHNATSGQTLHRGTFSYQAINVQTVVNQWLKDEPISCQLWNQKL